MPRKARLFASSSGSAARGFLKFRANIPPRWIKNAQKSRKRIEPEIVEALHSMISMRRNRPRAQVALKKANHEFKAVLSRWETAYNKENFYRGIRILLELQRNGSSKLYASERSGLGSDARDAEVGPTKAPGARRGRWVRERETPETLPDISPTRFSVPRWDIQTTADASGG